MQILLHLPQKLVSMYLIFKKERDEEFYEACKKAAKELIEKGVFITTIPVIKKAIMTPASSYFLDERNIANIIRSKELPKSEAKTELYIQIKKEYSDLLINLPFIKPETAAKLYISGYTAPRFYISIPRAINIYYDEYKRRHSKSYYQTKK